MPRNSNKIRQLAFIFLSLLLLLTMIPPFYVEAAGNRFGLNDDMTKRVADTNTISQLPFRQVWQKDLKRNAGDIDSGKVFSQPIIVDSMKAIFVQAGKDFIRLDYDGAAMNNPPKMTRLNGINDHEWPTASAPTYANTKFGPRIYQATRDHAIYAIDPTTMSVEWSGILSAGGKPDKRYRITTSPMVRTVGNRTFITVGTAHGDLTGLDGQYADDGFFVIEDLGSDKAIRFANRMQGEVTGSHLESNGNVYITENTLNQKSRLRIYNLNDNKLDTSMETELDSGVPTSPALDSGYLHIVDRDGQLYRINADSVNTQYTNKAAFPNSRVLEDPTIGDKYVFVPVRHYHGLSEGSDGAVLVVNKYNGQTVHTIELSSPLKNHTLYWKPDKAKPGFVIIFESNGTLRFIQEDTWTDIYWFKDSNGVMQKAPQLIQTSSQYTSPQLVFHDSLLLVVDGDGVMHAYRADRPIDLAITNFVSVGKDLNQIEKGEKVTLKATIANTSDIDLPMVPVTLATKEGTIATETIALPHGSTREVTFTTTMPESLPYFEVTVNPLQDTPPNEITFDNNKKMIAKPIDIVLEKLDYPKRWSVSEGVFEVKAHTFVDPKETGVTDPIDTEIELVVDGKKVKKSVTVHPNQHEQFNLSIDLSDKDFKDQTYLSGEVTINPEQTIFEDTYDNNSLPIKDVYLVQPYDLVAESIKANVNPARAGQVVTISARVKNESIEKQDDVLVVFTNEDKEIYRTNIDFAVGETKTISFPWTAPNQASADITVVVDPTEKAKDYNRKNNVQTMLLNIIANWLDPTCETTQEKGTWFVTYWYIYGYDKDGNPKWTSKLVRYSESLAAELSVNTKQGVVTDPKNPRSTDHESRGSYAIIPYAKKKGLKANEVTRAGYGFEVKVNTLYENDWERHIPQGYEGTAYPFGGEYKGPKEVQAVFIDTKGKVVAKVDLQKTSGNGYNDTWELPQASHKLLTGETITDRKHYVDINTPDGTYTVQILAKFAGHEGLSVCEKKTVTIYGNMWEDVQNIRQK